MPINKVILTKGDQQCLRFQAKRYVVIEWVSLWVTGIPVVLALNMIIIHLDSVVVNCGCNWLFFLWNAVHLTNPNYREAKLLKIWKIKKFSLVYFRHVFVGWFVDNLSMTRIILRWNFHYHMLLSCILRIYIFIYKA